jgi:FtsZ-interacting cell division protein YlmF
MGERVSKVVPISRPRNRGGVSVAEIVTLNPTGYQDARSISESLKFGGAVVVVNVSKVSDAERQRLIDFMSGLKEGLDASLQRASVDVYMLAPGGIATEETPDEQLDPGSSSLIFRP